MQPNSLYSDPGSGVFCVHGTQERFFMPDVHVHVQYEYLYVRQGTLIVENNTEKIKVKGPCMIIHNPYTLHRAYTTDDHEGLYDRYVINFNKALLDGLAEYIDNMDKIGGLGMSVIPLTEENSDYLKNCYEDILQSNRNAQYNRSILLLALITDTLIRWYVSDGKHNRVKSNVRYINELLQYISENLSLNLTLEELADLHFISRAKLVSDFRAVTGMSVKKYVTLMRINTAMTMLRSGVSVTETAEACGFCDDSHFIITFKKYTSMTPKEFSRIRLGKYTV